jgi:hypothetical protein
MPEAAKLKDDRYLANLRILDYVQPEILLLSAQALGLLRAVDSAYR